MWRISFSITYKLCSHCSRRTKRVGPACTILRHNSEPIEPPAPVTSTLLPAMCRCINSSLAVTGVRPSKSSTFTGRSCPTDAVPSSSSANVGTVNTRTPCAVACCTNFNRRARLAPGSANNNALMSCLANTFEIFSELYTGTLRIFRPCIFGSSSINATTDCSRP